MANDPNSQHNVVSTIAPVLERLIASCKEEVDNLKVVYDENLSYETAVKAFRRSSSQDVVDSDLYPLFAYRRSVLRYVKPDNGAPGRRLVSMRPSQQLSSTQSMIYRCVQGEFDVEFLYITKSALDMEVFEISYLSEEGFPNTKRLQVDMGGVFAGPLDYYCKFGDLTDKKIESDGVYYKGITGTFTVRGVYPVVTGVKPHITTVIGHVYVGTPDGPHELDKTLNITP